MQTPARDWEGTRGRPAAKGNRGYWNVLRGWGRRGDRLDIGEDESGRAIAPHSKKPSQPVYQAP